MNSNYINNNDNLCVICMDIDGKIVLCDNCKFKYCENCVGKIKYKCCICYRNKYNNNNYINFTDQNYFNNSIFFINYNPYFYVTLLTTISSFLIFISSFLIFISSFMVILCISLYFFNFFFKFIDLVVIKYLFN